jgi:two-component system, OmpR family, response regulator
MGQARQGDSPKPVERGDTTHMTDRPRKAAQRQFQRPHVLIVSDDPSLVEFLNEGLPLGGFWTSVIASGLQAIEVFRLRQFDLLLIDAGLTSFSPVELVRRLRGKSSRSTTGEQRTTAPIVIIAESNSDFPASLFDELDIETMITAPVELEDLVRTLHTTFENWQQRYPEVPLADFRSGILE